MAKIDARRAEALLRDPGAYRVVLLYGDDPGLVRERGDALRSAVAGGDDPFRVAEVAREAAAKDSGLLAAETTAQSLTGGRRFVRVQDAQDAVAPAVEAALSARGDGLLVLEAGELPARSRLRALLEPAPDAAVLACWRERGEALAATIERLLRDAGARAEPAAIHWLAQRLGEDRQQLRQEIEKLVVFAGEGGVIDEAAASLCVADGGAVEIEDALLAATAGDLAGADRGIEAALSEGASPIAILRAALRHVHRLQLAAETGGADALRPPVFFRHRPAFDRALRIWSSDALAAVSTLLALAELRAKSGSAARPIPDGAIARSAILGLARQAAALSARR